MCNTTNLILGLILGYLIIQLMKNVNSRDMFTSEEENGSSSSNSRPRSKQCSQASVNSSFLSYIFGSPQTTR